MMLVLEISGKCTQGSSEKTHKIHKRSICNEPAD